MYRLTFILFSLFVCITEASYLSCTDAMGLAENRAEQDEQPMGRALSEGRAWAQVLQAARRPDRQQEQGALRTPR